MASSTSFPKHRRASTAGASTNVIALDAHRHPASRAALERRRHAEHLRGLAAGLHSAEGIALHITPRALVAAPTSLATTSTIEDDVRAAVDALDELLAIRENQLRALAALRAVAIDPSTAGSDRERIRHLLADVIADAGRQEQLTCAIEYGLSLAAAILVRDERNDVVDAAGTG